MTDKAAVEEALKRAGGADWIYCLLGREADGGEWEMVVATAWRPERDGPFHVTTQGCPRAATTAPIRPGGKAVLVARRSKPLVLVFGHVEPIPDMGEECLSWARRQCMPALESYPRPGEAGFAVHRFIPDDGNQLDVTDDLTADIAHLFRVDMKLSSPREMAALVGALFEVAYHIPGDGPEGYDPATRSLRLSLRRDEALLRKPLRRGCLNILLHGLEHPNCRCVLEFRGVEDVDASDDWQNSRFGLGMLRVRYHEDTNRFVLDDESQDIDIAITLDAAEWSVSFRDLEPLTWKGGDRWGEWCAQT